MSNPSSWSFTTLSATAAIGPLMLLSWNYNNPTSASQQIQSLTLYITDPSLNDNNNPTITTIIPLRDISNSLVTSYAVPGLTVGSLYQFMIEANCIDPSNNYYLSNSPTTTCMQSSIPPQPQTFLLSQLVGGKVLVSFSLSDSSYVPVKPFSAYDGYSVLNAATIMYNDGVTIRTELFQNDASNSLYGLNAMAINNLSNKEYEFAIRLFNELGSSRLSLPQTFNVQVPIPGAPANLSGNPTMFVDPSFNVANPPSITLSWQPPSVLGDPSLNSYTVSKNGLVLATLLPDASGIIPTQYVDAANLVAGSQYQYNVSSNSDATGVNGVVANFSSVNVTAAAPPTILGTPVVIASNNSFSVDVSYNPNGFTANQISFDLSGNNGIGLQNFTTEPFTVNNLSNGNPLSNGTQYSCLVRVKGTANGVSVYSAFTSIPIVTPFATLLPLTNVAISNVDGSGVPLNGKLNLSWSYPNNLPSYQSSVPQTVYIYKKLTSAPDASYSLISSSLTSPNGVSFQDTNLTNGTSYSYKLQNSQPNPNSGGPLNISSTVIVSAIPFIAPGQVMNLNFVDASMTYSFNAPFTSGGLPLAGYMLILSNVSNGGNVLVQTINSTARDSSNNLITTGNLSQYTLPGRTYNLSVQAYVSNSGTNVFGAAVNDIAYSTPEALAAPVASNVDASSNPINGGNALLVNWAINAGYDSSSARYAVYRNGSVLPLPDASNLSVTSYTNTGLTNGSPNYYQVQMLLGSTSSPLSPVSNTIAPFSYPANVTNPIYAVTGSSSVNLSWTQSNVNGTGIAQSSVWYRVFDMSTNTLLSTSQSTSAVISNLTPGVNYRLGIQAGAASNGGVYYSNLNGTPVQINVATYQIPVNPPSGLNIYPSNASALVDVNEAPTYSGLTFSQYVYQWKLSTDTSYNAGISTSSSAQYIPSSQTPALVNFSTYNVQVTLKYLDVNNNVILSPPTQGSVTPETAPNQPTGFQILSSSANQLILRWNVASDATNYTCYRSTVSGNIGDPIFQDAPATAGGGVLVPAVNNTKWEFIDSTVTPGTTYYYSLVALKQANNLYVSSQAATASGIPYSAPSSPQNLSYTSGNGNVNVTWSPPDNTAGAGLGGNGPLYYQLTINGPNNTSGVFSDISATNLVITNYTDVSTNLNVNLVNGVQYNISVVSAFNIQNVSTNKAISTSSTIVAQPRSPPMTPVATAVASNTASTGLQITLTLAIDPSSNTDSNNTQVYLTRVIRDVCNNILSTVSNQLLSGVVFNSSLSGLSATIIDSPNSNIANDPNNFLNGNTMSYTFNVKNINWAVNNTVSTNSNSVSAVPAGQPIISSLSIDLSGNLNANINRNGSVPSPDNALIALGFDTVGGNTVKVVEVPSSAISFSNNQQNGVVAKHQLASYKFLSSNWSPNPIQEALLIFSSNTGAALLDTPPGSVLG